MLYGYKSLGEKLPLSSPEGINKSVTSHCLSLLLAVSVMRLLAHFLLPLNLLLLACQGGLAAECWDVFEKPRPMIGEMVGGSAFTTGQIGQILQMHRTAREDAAPCSVKHYMPAIEWDVDLANTAQVTADNCNPMYNNSAPVCGTNVDFVVPGGAQNATADGVLMVKRWVEEEVCAYNFHEHKCHEGCVCHHYAELIDGHHKVMGCGVAHCDRYSSNGQSATVVVCVYRKAPHCCQFLCANGHCIEKEKYCNGIDDCGDNSDEYNCGPPCKEGEFLCDNGSCIPNSQRCNGQNNCGDNSDEENCPTTVPPCNKGEFECNNGACIFIGLRCNGVNNCGDNSDEENCPTTLPPACLEGQFQCNNLICIAGSQRCNGQNNCGDNSDEQGCTPPPPA